jgi:hypothetical protein
MPPSTVSAKLGVAPLLRCRAKTADLIQTSEASGWSGSVSASRSFATRCSNTGGRRPITGITDRALLRDPHLVPWAECEDALRLDVHDPVQFRC